MRVRCKSSQSCSAVRLRVRTEYAEFRRLAKRIAGTFGVWLSSEQCRNSGCGSAIKLQEKHGKSEEPPSLDTTFIAERIVVVREQRAGLTH